MNVILQPESALTTVEAGRRLGIRPGDVYRLIFAGQLTGGPDRRGTVRVTEQALGEYVAQRAASAR